MNVVESDGILFSHYDLKKKTIVLLKFNYVLMDILPAVFYSVHKPWFHQMVSTSQTGDQTDSVSVPAFHLMTL